MRLRRRAARRPYRLLRSLLQRFREGFQMEQHRAASASRRGGSGSSRLRTTVPSHPGRGRSRRSRSLACWRLRSSPGSSRRGPGGWRGWGPPRCGAGDAGRRAAWRGCGVRASRWGSHGDGDGSVRRSSGRRPVALACASSPMRRRPSRAGPPAGGSRAASRRCGGDGGMFGEGAERRSPDGCGCRGSSCLSSSGCCRGGSPDGRCGRTGAAHGDTNSCSVRSGI